MIYLTHHATIPEQDLRESIECLAHLSDGRLAARLHWLPWRDVERAIGVRVHDGAPLARVRAVLRRARMYWFDDTSWAAPPSASSSPRVYRAAHSVVASDHVSVMVDTRGSTAVTPQRAYHWPAVGRELGARLVTGGTS